MPLRHEGKKDGSSPLKGEFGMTSLLRPAGAIEKTPPERLSFPRTPHSGRPRSAIPDTKRLHDASRSCHSCRGKCDGEESMSGGSRRKDLYMDGLTSHRSQATAQSSVGMTCLLRPAEAIEKTP